MMDDRRVLETLLLQRIQERKPELEAMLQRMNEHWTYEDPVYRFYHHSFKVYYLQSETEDAVRLLQSLLPGRSMNQDFSQIVAEGTGRVFDTSHNQDWGTTRGRSWRRSFTASS